MHIVLIAPKIIEIRAKLVAIHCQLPCLGRASARAACRHGPCRTLAVSVDNCLNYTILCRLPVLPVALRACVHFLLAPYIASHFLDLYPLDLWVHSIECAHGSSAIRPRMRLRRPFPLTERHATPHSGTLNEHSNNVYNKTREAGARERAPRIGAVDSLPSREDQALTVHNERLVHSHVACERVRTAVCRQLTSACHRRSLTCENNRAREEKKTCKQRKRHSTQPLENTQAAP